VARAKDNMRRICHIHLRPLLSGVQNWTLRFFESLPPDEYELHVILASEGEFSEELERRGVRVHFVPSLVRQLSPLRDTLSLIRLIRILRRGDFDLVHTHSSKTGTLGRIAARIAGVPAILHHVHGLSFHEFTGRLQRWLAIVAEWISALFCDRIIFVNDEERVWSVTHHMVAESKACTIYNGADLEIYNPTKRDDLRGALRTELGIGPDQAVITFVGRLEPQKDPLQLVPTLARLCERYPEIDPILVVAGDGPLRPRLAQAAEQEGHASRVRILGWRNDVPKILSAADVLYLPSRWEGLPLTLVEAACMGIPAVATDVKGNREAIEHDRTGALVAVGDTDAAACALGEILTSRARSEQLSRASAERAQERYDVRKNSLEVQKEYDELLARAVG
jgi:glycosyltransferase involved in cell wall biosynthesis